MKEPTHRQRRWIVAIVVPLIAASPLAAADLDELTLIDDWENWQLGRNYYTGACATNWWECTDANPLVDGIAVATGPDNYVVVPWDSSMRKYFETKNQIRIEVRHYATAWTTDGGAFLKIPCSGQSNACATLELAPVETGAEIVVRACGQSPFHTGFIHPAGMWRVYELSTVAELVPESHFPGKLFVRELIEGGLIAELPYDGGHGDNCIGIPGVILAGPGGYGWQNPPVHFDTLHADCCAG